jgi:bla regulator protein BlaR1
MTLLQMSLSGGVMILAAALVRALALHRLPKRFFVLPWTLALVRLLVPFSLPAACSVYSLFSRPTPVAVYAPGPVGLSPALPSAWTGGVGEAFVSEGAAVSAADPWGMIWLTGLALCAGYFGVAYFKCRREFREALPVHNAYVEQWIGAHKLRRPIAVRQSDKITAPLAYGVLRPVILLPKSTDWNDRETLDYVLTHEWVHIRRFDGLLKLALTAALCLHWFNPLVWAMALFANRDIELACDEAVLKRLGREARTGYALALLGMEERKSGLSLAGSHFSKNSLEERIKAMMKQKKTSLAALLAALVLIGGTGAVFATSAKAENQGALLRPGAEAETTYSTESKDSLLSYTDADGVTYYSWDEGKTWTPMTEEEFSNAYPDPDV